MTMAVTGGNGAVPGAGPGGTGGGPAPGSDGPATEAPKSKKKLLLVVGVVVVLLLVGFVAKGKLLKPHYGPGDPPPAGQVYSLGGVTTSLSDGHLLQTTIQLQLTVVTTTKKVTTDQPKLLNAAINTLGEQTYTGLLAPSGRTALKAALLKDFQTVLGTSGGAQEVDKVYLTSFVLQ